MQIIDNIIEFPSIRSEDREVIDKAFKDNLSCIQKYPDIEGICLAYTGLEEEHLEILIKSLEGHQNLKSLILPTNFRTKPHNNLMDLIAKFVKAHPTIEEIDLEYCNLQDEDIEKLFTQLTKKEISSIYFRISKNNDLTLQTAKLVLKHKSHISTIKGLADNYNIYSSDSPEKDRIDYISNTRNNGTPGDDQPHFVFSSKDESENEDKPNNHDLVKPYNLRSKK